MLYVLVVVILSANNFPIEVNHVTNPVSQERCEQAAHNEMAYVDNPIFVTEGNSYVQYDNGHKIVRFCMEVEGANL